MESVLPLDVDAVGDGGSVREARRRYFLRNGFGEDGGYGARWVKLGKGPIPIGFPNFEARRRAVRCHDIHHLVTGYPTTWLGEAEIAAWELASGCRDYWAAWILNLGGLMIGLVIGPRAVFRACVRGRRSDNLYGREIDDALLARSVGEVRRELALDRQPGPAGPSDAAVFTGLSALALLYNFSGLALVAWWLW